MKKTFQTKRKLLFGVLKFTDAAIEKTEQLTANMKQYQTDKTTEREKGNSTRIATAIPALNTTELEYPYGAERFEAYEKSRTATEINILPKESNKTVIAKSR